MGADRVCRLVRMALLPTLLTTLPAMGIPAVARAAPQRPNVVLIMTDNHGAWTLGCYGNPDIRTPHIDRLAAEGMLFTRAFASNPVCSPTRATFLTGLLPSQHGVHCYLRAGRLQVGPAARSTLAEFRSLPEVLRDAGYTCGLVGKWHLGDNLHPQEGFDGYWITMPHGGTTTFYDAPIIENGRIRKESKYLTDFWTEHAVRFIDQVKDGGKPFFLFLAYNGPYALSRFLLREGRNRHAAYYADKELASFPREKAHPWLYSNRDYINNPVSIRRVATEVSGIDDGVGEVMAALKRSGLDRNTVVIFTADQGWVGGQGGFWGMGDHTRPLTAFDGMMHIPMIWRHPGHISAGKRAEIMVSNYDFMPTLIGYLGLGGWRDRSRSPGRDFTRVLRGGSAPEWDNTVFFEFEDTRAVRTDRWKYVHRHPSGPFELYDLENDPGERTNLYDDEAHASTRDRLQQRLGEFYDRYADPKYDLWRGGGAQTAILRAIEAPPVASDPVEPPPLADGFRPARLRVPGGYTVGLAAGPPLVEHPMLASFDDRGRLFIAESAGFNLPAEELEERLPNFVRMLEDIDGDGRFDRSTTFADRMTFPMGAVWYQGALYVAAPPNIWRLEDSTGDGVADRRTVLVGRFGYTGNAASVHGCFLGPEGRLYWCDGRHGHEFRDAGGKVTQKRDGAYIFSANLDGSDPRPHCGGGMDNPVEVDFTEEGEVLGTVNIFYSRPRVDCLVHWLYGGVYPHSERVLGEFKRTGGLLGPVQRFGHVTVSGMTRYRSGMLEHALRNDIFVAVFNSGKVLRCELERHGATFQSVPHEFLASESPDFHPTDVLEDADGSLLVIDTGGWFHRGCPTSQVAKPEIKGAIYRVRRKGMTTVADPWGTRLDWATLPNGRLVGLLGDTRFKVRERAVATCAERGEAIVSSLEEALRRRDTRSRLNALWALTRIGSQKSRAAVRKALDDRAPRVRLAACRSIATTVDAKARGRLIELLGDEMPAVRRLAATALGRIGQASAVPALLAASGRAVDRAEEHAMIYALIEIADARATAKGLKAADPRIRKAALIALDQMEDGGLTPGAVAPLFEESDEALRSAALDVFRRRPAWAAEAAMLLEALLRGGKATEGRETIVRGLTEAFIADPRVGSLAGRVLGDSATPEATRRLLLSAMADHQSLPLHETWIEPFARLLDSDDESLVDVVLAAVRAIDTERFDATLTALGADAKLPRLLRFKALEATRRSGRLGDAAFGLLTELLGDASTLRDVARGDVARAAQILSATSLTRRQLLTLAPLLEHAGPLELRDLIRPFQRDQNVEVARAFLTYVEKSPGFSSLAPNEFSDVIKRYPEPVLPAANRLLDQLKTKEEEKGARLEELQALLKKGDVERGRALFTNEKSRCSDCHRIGSNGGAIGPDLSSIGGIRSPRDLLESIVFPSLSLVREYEPYTVVTTKGEALVGLIAKETAEALYIQQQTGEPVPVARDEVANLEPGTVSIMPQGLDEVLTPEEVADLVAYLSSLR